MSKKPADRKLARGDPAPFSMFASERSSPEVAALTRELTRRMSGNDHLAEQPLPPIEAIATDESSVARARRISDFSELKKATQQAALAQWNSSSNRPPWSLEILRRYAPAPVDVDGLSYLDPPQRDILRGWAENDRRYVRLEREAIGLMREAHDWLERAQGILHDRHASDGVIGPAMRALERLLEPPSEIESIINPFGGPAGERAPVTRTRSNLVHDVPLLLRRDAYTREVACASLLFGLFPKKDDDAAWMGTAGRTVAEAIEAECKLIDKAKRRSKT